MYDDSITQIQLVKNKLAYREDVKYLAPLNEGSYEYLVEHVLFSVFNKEKFADRVREIYNDIVLGDRTTPDLYDIVEAIDYENMVIIREYYDSIGFSQNEIDNVMAHYDHDISPMMDDWIEEVLISDGRVFHGMPLMKMFKVKHEGLVSGDGQNIVNPEWL